MASLISLHPINLPAGWPLRPNLEPASGCVRESDDDEPAKNGDRSGDNQPERSRANGLGLVHLCHCNADHAQHERGIAPRIIRTATCSSRTRRVIVASCWSISDSWA